MRYYKHFLQVLLYCIAILLFIIISTSFKKIINTKSIIYSQAFFETGYERAISQKNRTEKFKYILQWTSSENVPFNNMGLGQSAFIERKCAYVNCYVTTDRSFLGDYTEFDVVVFNGPDIVQYHTALPDKRSPSQKYVFASIESSDYYGLCPNDFDGYFNWTWTYRLDSEVRWGYIVIRDINYNIIGPKKDMHWMKTEDMWPVNEQLKRKLRTKTKAVAWFVSNCESQSKRELFVSSLTAELYKYKHVTDIYGKCGSYVCPRDKEIACNKRLARKYYFYLAFENALSEDYVTEKLLLALRNNVVPIVYGGANYTRFMPDGIYLNALELGVKDLAKKIADLISDPEQYAQFFKWKNHYSYHRTIDSIETNEYCGICALLNNEKMMNKTSVYKDFRDWWNTDYYCDI